MEALETDYIDTPKGIVTPGGVSFEVDSADLNRWAGSLFESVSLRQLIAEAMHWQTFPKNFILWLAPALIGLANPWVMAGLSLLLVPILKLLLAPMASSTLVKLSRYADFVPAQGLYYVLVLTLIGRTGAGLVVVLLLAVFVLVRTGIIDLVTESIVQAISKKLYRLRTPDVSLRALIVNSAALHGIVLEGHEEFGTKGTPFSWRK